MNCNHLKAVPNAGLAQFPRTTCNGASSLLVNHKPYKVEKCIFFMSWAHVNFIKYSSWNPLPTNNNLETHIYNGNVSGENGLCSENLKICIWAIGLCTNGQIYNLPPTQLICKNSPPNDSWDSLYDSVCFHIPIWWHHLHLSTST
jgi:hypothetical protein